MNLLRMTTFSLAVCVSLSAAQAGWMNFTVGSPAAGTGTWPGGSAYTGSATVTASNFINGISWTPLVGLTPNNIGNLSPDFYGAGLVPNAGNVVPFITTPYNDSGDKYHVDIDFAGTSFGSLTGVLPAGTLIALGNLDINENYRNISATNAA
ncbi:MAG TPA: hypothetical protein PKC18_02135, partial [Lacipirellulaceae bacterium]|nr:hypothetical protein [Lacipirellulaceae bacterium]